MNREAFKLNLPMKKKSLELTLQFFFNFYVNILSCMIYLAELYHNKKPK